jgi:hypothetical protein
MRTHLQFHDEEWEKLKTQIEDDTVLDPHIFSKLLDSYLQRMKQVRGAYQSFCKKIFML